MEHVISVFVVGLALIPTMSHRTSRPISIAALVADRILIYICVGFVYIFYP